MNRERALKIVLVLVGLLFSAAIVPIVIYLWRGSRSEATLTMMLSVYMTLGIFLLLAARNPSAYGTLIAFTAWSSFAHAAVMAVQSFELSGDRAHLLGGTAFFIVAGVSLIALAPRKEPTARAQEASA